MATADPWLGADKVQHAVGSFGMVLAVYAILRVPPLQRRVGARTRLIVAMSASFSVGGIKELGDGEGWWWFCPCMASARDMATNLIGVAAGGALLLLGRACPDPFSARVEKACSKAWSAMCCRGPRAARSVGGAQITRSGV